MPDDETQEVPLPEGTIPDQENVVTQEIAFGKEAFPAVKLISPVKVDLPPVHLLGDPIMTMDAPVADNTPLYDQLNPPAPLPVPERPRRRMKTGDKVLACMGVAALGMTVGVYGMVVNGWGAGSMPEEAAKPASTVSAAPSEEPVVLPTTGEATHRVREKEPVTTVADPATPTPEWTQSITVVTPTPTETVSASETPEETIEAPEPSPTPTKPSTPPPSPTTSAPSPSPTPTQSSASPSFSISLPASPTEENPDE